MNPLVTCVTPTANRRAHIPTAIKCFLNQDYDNLEMIILDNGTDRVADLIPNDPHILYVPIDQQFVSLGEKRNFINAMAKGEYIVNWDDDDWSAPTRVSRQVLPLIADSNLQVSGSSQLYYFTFNLQPQNTKAFIYKSPEKPNWLGAIAYPKAVWNSFRYDENPQTGEDTRFQYKTPPNSRHDVQDPSLFVCGIHLKNDSPKNTQGTGWGEIPWQKVTKVMGL